MILLDSDVLMIDQRYQNDARYALNRQALQRLQAEKIPLGITTQVLLEVVGNLSFNVAPQRLALLPNYLCTYYGLTVWPDVQHYPYYAGCTVQEVLMQMSRQMVLGDAVQAIQIATHASFAHCLLTWNAKHFSGKLVIPVLTPGDWLAQQAPPTP